MNGGSEPETAPCGVANLANSPAISCDPRLAGDRFESHSRLLRINQRFPKSRFAILVRVQIGAMLVWTSLIKALEFFQAANVFIELGDHLVFLLASIGQGLFIDEDRIQSVRQFLG